MDKQIIEIRVRIVPGGYMVCIPYLPLLGEDGTAQSHIDRYQSVRKEVLRIANEFFGTTQVRDTHPAKTGGEKYEFIFTIPAGPPGEKDLIIKTLNEQKDCIIKAVDPEKDLEKSLYKIEVVSESLLIS